ncbi:hypothetical protein JCM16303_004230 [Sporobolomyces ruberrimus]
MRAICDTTDPRTLPYLQRRGFYIDDPDNYVCTPNDLHYTGERLVEDHHGNGRTIPRLCFEIPAVCMRATRQTRSDHWLTYSGNSDIPPANYEVSVMAGGRWAGVLGMFDRPESRRRRQPAGMESYANGTHNLANNNCYSVTVEDVVGQMPGFQGTYKYLLRLQEQELNPIRLFGEFGQPAPRTVTYNGTYQFVETAPTPQVMITRDLEITATLDPRGPHHAQVRLPDQLANVIKAEPIHAALVEER